MAGLVLIDLSSRWAFLERGIERVVTDLESGIDMVTVCWYKPFGLGS